MPFDVGSAPLANDFIRGNLQKMYRNGRKSKAFAVSPQGAGGIFVGQGSPEEAVRRALGFCGSRAGGACGGVAVVRAFRVPRPSALNVGWPVPGARRSPRAAREP